MATIKKDATKKGIKKPQSTAAAVTTTKTSAKSSFANKGETKRNFSFTNNTGGEQTRTYQYTKSGMKLRDKQRNRELTLRLRYEPQYKNFDLVLTIYNLTNDGSFARNEEGKIDSGYFPLSMREVSTFSYFLNMIREQKITGINFNHINKTTNSGSLLEVLYVDGVIVIYVNYIVNGEREQEWSFQLDYIINFDIYDNNGDITPLPVNTAFEEFASLIQAAPGIMSLGRSLFDFRFSSNNNFGGTVSSNRTPSFGASARQMLSSNEEDEEDEEQTEDFEENDEDLPLDLGDSEEE